jgi:hypothetical protein
MVCQGAGIGDYLCRLRSNLQSCIVSLAQRCYFPLLTGISAPVSIAQLYFDTKINPVVAIFFMWAIVWIGYSYAAIARQFLLYDPVYPWYEFLEYISQC